ncbi:MAG: M20/M25/M40 family metallo-hydrolase [Chloroflexi bacterium]|nr:M20/M25/M40 family metallo-hydrolase [Chloroflexota bacterium]
MQVERVLADLIRIPSVNPPGGEIGVARYLKGLFDQHGIPNEIIEPEPGRANFLACLGEGDRSLLYVSHTDVVPATGDWGFDPFSGDITDGFVYGRGALDCKGLVAAEACAVIGLAEQARLRGKLTFAAVADEEAGSAFGVQHLVARCPDKLRADFAINEGAEAPYVIGGKTCHFIGVGEKGPAWVSLKAKGVSAHGSLPMLGDNAVVKMARAIDRLASYEPQIVLIPEVKTLVSSIARLLGSPGEVDAANVDQIIEGVKDRNLAGYLTAITRMTVSPNDIHGGAKVNIVPDSCEAEVDVRVLPGQDAGYVARELGPLAGGVEMSMMQYNAPTFSSADAESYRLVYGTLREFISDAPVLPSISSGATDSRFLRGMGMPCYGIGMMTLSADPAMKQGVHGKNEKIDIASLQLKSEFLQRLGRRYLGDY